MKAQGQVAQTLAGQISAVLEGNEQELADALRTIPDLAVLVADFTVTQGIVIQHQQQLLQSVRALFAAVQVAPRSAEELWAKLEQ